MGFTIVAAADEELGIGKDGDLAWKIPDDMAFFERVTRGGGPVPPNAVIMGRGTWDSIPTKYRPLRERFNIVLTRRGIGDAPEGVAVVGNLSEGLAIAEERESNEIFVIGGGQIYREAIERPDCETVLITRVQGTFGCDTFFPTWEDKGFVRERVLQKGESGGVKFRVEEWRRG